MSARCVVRLVAGLCLVGAIIGCSDRGTDKWRQMVPPTHAASGTVTFKGKPLAGATVVFHPREGSSSSRRAAAGLTNSAGRFRLTTLKPGDGAAAGSFLVTVEKTTPTVAGATTPPATDSAVFPLGPDPSFAKPLIPEKYFSPETSGLSADVQPSGRNAFVFTID